MLQVLSDGPGDERRASRAYAAIHTFTLGFAALEASRRSASVAKDDPLTRELAEYASPAQFSRGTQGDHRWLLCDRVTLPTPASSTRDAAAQRPRWASASGRAPSSPERSWTTRERMAI